MAYQTRPVDLEFLAREQSALLKAQQESAERNAAYWASRPASNPSLWQRIKEWVLRAA